MLHKHKVRVCTFILLVSCVKLLVSECSFPPAQLRSPAHENWSVSKCPDVFVHGGRKVFSHTEKKESVQERSP